MAYAKLHLLPMFWHPSTIENLTSPIDPEHIIGEALTRRVQLRLSCTSAAPLTFSTSGVGLTAIKACIVKNHSTAKYADVTFRSLAQTGVDNKVRLAAGRVAVLGGLHPGSSIVFTGQDTTVVEVELILVGT